MPTVNRSAKLYAERRGLRETYRTPVPTFQSNGNPANRLQLQPPLPVPTLMLEEDIVDIGKTTEWPWHS